MKLAVPPAIAAAAATVLSAIVVAVPPSMYMAAHDLRQKAAFAMSFPVLSRLDEGATSVQLCLVHQENGFRFQDEDRLMHLTLTNAATAPASCSWFLLSVGA